MPEISVVTAGYNQESYIGRTIESVQGQTFTNWEHVIVDDGSTDGLAAVVQTYVPTEPRLRLIRQPNGGVSNARNNGFSACSPDSRYLLFLDGDDCLEPDMLTVMKSYLDDHPEVGLAHSSWISIDRDDRVIDKKDGPRYSPSGLFGVRRLPPDYAETPFASVFVFATIVPSLTLLRRSVYELTPGWDEMIGPGSEDTDLAIHIALRSKVHFIPRELVRQRSHEGQAQRDTKRRRAQADNLYHKWYNMRGLIYEHRAMIEQGRRFREGRLSAYAYLKWGNDHLHAGNLVEGVKCYLRCVKRLLLINVLRGQLAVSQDQTSNSSGSDDC